MERSKIDRLSGDVGICHAHYHPYGSGVDNEFTLQVDNTFKKSTVPTD
jgi:hypothetical protein